MGKRTITHPIATLLKERNLHVHDVAQACGVSERAVYFWMNGQRTMSPQQRARVAHFFHVTPDQVVK